jgi:N-acetylglucosaminyl-diphospho-decaprenol L-rhamnosyltransferase
MSDVAPRRVDAVVVTHSRPGLAIACLQSLRPLVPREQAVVVVNAPDGADPTTLTALNAYGTVIANEWPHGYGQNLNRGVSASSGDADYLLLLNDDLVFADDALEHLVAALDANPAAGLAAPAIVGQDGAAHAAAFDFPSVRSETLQAAILPAAIAERWRASFARAATPGPPRVVDWALGAAMLVRREAFVEVGGFDSGYFMYSEETDLSRRLHRHGWHVLSCGDAVVTHLAAASTHDERFARMLGRSRGRYLRRTLSQADLLGLAAALFLVAVWNVSYVALRILLSPSLAKTKIGLLRQHWRTRPILQGGAG